MGCLTEQLDTDLKREDQIIVWGLTGLGIAVSILFLVLLPAEEPSPIQPVGEQVTNQTEDEVDEQPGEGPEEDIITPVVLSETNQDPLSISDIVRIELSRSGGDGALTSGGNGGGGGGGGSSRDRTPPTVTGIFSRPPDTTDRWYTHPFTVTWVGEDDRSGIDFCDPPEDYSGPDGSSIVLEGQCTDRAGNVGTGHVTFSYNATRFEPVFLYDLTLSSNIINAGSDISADARTNDTRITQVGFFWKDPSNNVAASKLKTVTVAGDRIAIDIFTAPNQSGVWTIDAHFKNATGDDLAMLVKNFTVVSPAINYIYSLTLDRETVQINTPILATAGTNDTSIIEVEFVWSDPQTNVKASHVRPFSSSNGTAGDSFVPDALGEWKVAAHFNSLNQTGIAIKSKPFSVVEEPDGTVNQKPVALDDNVTTLEDIPVTIDVLANDFDPDGDSFFISSFTQAGNGSVTDSLNGTLTYSPRMNYNGQDSFTYKISDGSLESVNATVTISITPVNEPPTANAGLDQIVNEESLVSLNGSATDVDERDNLIFSWSQISGPITVTLTDAGSLSPSFTAPSINHTDAALNLTLSFELVVRDDAGSNSSDTVVVVVNDVNKPPVADAGPEQTVNEKDCFCSENKDDEDEEDCSRSTLVSLSGIGSSDDDGDALTFSWKQIDGPSVELIDASSITISFTAPKVDEDAILTFELFVIDNFGGNSTDTVDILVLDTDDEAGEEIKVTGGGTLAEDDGINFGFVVILHDQCEGIEGQMEYHDKNAIITLHSLSMTSLIVNEDRDQATFEGTARLNGQEGEYRFIVTVEDNGEPGENDKFAITVPDLNYTSEGTIIGNIQIHS